MKLPLYQPDAATATRFLFFTGKGGVGKTSLSCATALKLADAGKRVLLVSTDPASNLDEVLETKLTNAAHAHRRCAGPGRAEHQSGRSRGGVSRALDRPHARPAAGGGAAQHGGAAFRILHGGDRGL